jgi:hypothetical protein
MTAPSIRTRVGGDARDKRKPTDAAPEPGSAANDDRRGVWPWWGQFMLALAAMILAAVFLIGLPYLIATNSSAQAWEAMVGPLLGLTTMTISGIFVFMTFRIDRGARAEARDTAEKAAVKKVNSLIEAAVREQVEALLEIRLNAAQLRSDARIHAADRRMEARVDASDRQMDARISTIDDLTRERLSQANSQIDGRVREAEAQMNARFEEQVRAASARVEERIEKRIAEARTNTTNLLDDYGKLAERIKALVP